MLQLQWLQIASAGDVLASCEDSVAYSASAVTLLFEQQLVSLLHMVGWPVSPLLSMQATPCLQN
jgi:hypothetical protein